MSLILKSGSSGILADVVNVGGVNGLVVSVAGALASGSNLIGQVEITDGANILGTIANPVVTSQAPHQDIIVSGTIASSPTANVAIDSQSSGTVMIYISGSWSGTLQFEGSPDGTNWVGARAFPKPSNAVSQYSTTANGVWVFSTAGANMFRVRASAWSTGTATIHLEASQSTQVVQCYQLYPQNLQTLATSIGTLQDDTTDAETYTQNIGVLSAHATAFDLPHPQNMLSHLQMDLFGNLRTRSRSESILGDLIVLPRLNQVEINFSEGFNPDLVTSSSSGSGSFIQVDGAGEWHVGTGITGAASGISTQALKYHPGHEWYAKFTSAFTTPTDSFNPNYQRIGPYNATDGFFIGFEKTTFSFTQVQNSVLTSLPKASWNGDPVDGSANSGFTRLGIPEVLNFQNINIYRIRGSWFGTAPVQLQVFSPDMDWVTLHTFQFPNTQQLPFTFTTDWNMAVEVFKSGSDTTDLRIRCACLVLGTNNDTAAVNEPLTDYSQAKLVRSILTGKNTKTGVYSNVGLSTDNAVTVSGSGTATVNTAVWDSTTPQDTAIQPLTNDYYHNTVTVALVSTAPIDTGAITFEASIDNVHFLGIIGVDVSTGLSIPSPVVNIVGGTTKLYTFNVSGFSYFQYRLSTQIGQLSPPLPAGTVTSSYLLQSLSSPSVSTTITTGSISVASNQGAPNTLGNAWPMELTDSTHGPVTVKGSSTPALVTDNALVVAISPNNSVAVTGTFFPATQPVSGTVAVSQSTSPWITQDSRFTHNVAQDGSGNIGVNVQNFPSSTVVSGGVTAQILDAGGVNKATVNSGGQLYVDLPKVEFIADTTSPPTSVVLVGGRSADVTPVYSPIPLAAGSGSVVVSGTVSVIQSTSPWVVSGTVTSNIGTTGGLALDATLTGGTQVTKLADAGGVNQAAISATGVLSVDGSSVIQPVSGTVAVSTVTSITNPVTVNQGTTPWVTDDANAVAQGTLLTGVNGFLQMGSVTTAAPSYTNGEISPLSLDPSGNLRVAIEGSIIASNNITEWNSVALGSPSAYGTSPGAVNVIGVNAFVTNTVTISGTVTANAGTGNFTVVQATASNLNATVVGTGTFAVQATQSGTWNIGTLTTITNPVTVVGDSASGAAKAGNPVQVGGVFNTTQPTVTTGQTGV